MQTNDIAESIPVQNRYNHRDYKEAVHRSQIIHAFSKEFGSKSFVFPFNI